VYPLVLAGAEVVRRFSLGADPRRELGEGARGCGKASLVDALASTGKNSSAANRGKTGELEVDE
jgi:predicted AAA+ superfamily ATPase